MFKLSGYDILKTLWDGLKEEAYEITASRFAQGVVVGAVLASVVWTIAVFGR